MNEHERAFLSALMAKPELYDEYKLSVSDFTGDGQRLFRAISEIIEAGDKPDALMLFDRGVDATLAAQLDAHVGNPRFYHEQIIDASLRRKVVNLRAELSARIEDEKPANVLEWLQEWVSEESATRSGDIVQLRTLMMPTIQEVERRFHLEGGIDGITSGFHGMDGLLNGFRPGQLIIMAARPSIGKTALALSMALNQCKARIAVGFDSLEMSRHELGVRLLAMEAKINMRVVQNGMMTAANFGEITDAADALYAAEMLIDDRPNMPLDVVRSSLRQMVRKGSQVLYVDYMGLVAYGPPGMGMYERVGHIAKSLKGLARELQVPIVALAQLNRQAEDNTPSLAHLAESGQIEMHADVIIMIDRERESETGDLHVVKARNAKTGHIPVTFKSTYVRYEE